MTGNFLLLAAAELLKTFASVLVTAVVFAVETEPIALLVAAVFFVSCKTACFTDPFFKKGRLVIVVVAVFLISLALVLSITLL